MSLIYSPPPADPSATQQRRHSGLYLGGKTDAKARDKLLQFNVTHILNVTPAKESGVQSGVPNYFERQNDHNNKYPRIVYKRLQVYDSPTSDLLQHADAVVQFISSGLCHGSVLVHCQRGVSRSATCVAFYLMRKAGMSLQEALETMKRKRPSVNPIPAFMKQLEQYEAKGRRMGWICEKKDETRTTKKSSTATDNHDKEERSSAKRAHTLIGPAFEPPPLPSSEIPMTKKAKVIGPSLTPPTKRATSDDADKVERKRIIGPQIGPRGPESSHDATKGL